MLLEMFIFFEMIAIGMFIAAFFTKQEILWAITAVISGVLMVTSFNIEVNTFEFNNITGVYTPIQLSYSYPYLMGINIVFFGLALLLGMFDIFEKYGVGMWKKKGGV